jgi:hypothetical protein
VQIPCESATDARIACASKLYDESKDPISREPDFHDYLYGDDIQKHEAQYAARARAAIEAGLEPPPYEPFDPTKIETEAQRRDKAWREEIEKNREIARQIVRLHSDPGFLTGLRTPMTIAGWNCRFSAVLTSRPFWEAPYPA